MKLFNLLTGLILFDIIITLYGVLYLGATELNPLCVNFFWFMVAKIIVSFGCLLTVYHYRYDRYVKCAIIISIILYLIIAVNNVYHVIAYCML
jgi:hypothetical protein